MDSTITSLQPNDACLCDHNMITVIKQLAKARGVPTDYALIGPEASQQWIGVWYSSYPPFRIQPIYRMTSKCNSISVETFVNRLMNTFQLDLNKAVQLLKESLRLVPPDNDGYLINEQSWKNYCDKLLSYGIA